MADKKISQLTGASTPLAGTEVLPIVQSGATVKVAISDVTAGRAVSATQFTATTGNFIVGTAGQGIDFSVNSGAAGMTSELLSRYEEGTFTPVVADADTGGNTGTGTFTGRYTRIGRMVNVMIDLTNIVTTGMTSTAAVRVRGLPYTPASSFNQFVCSVAAGNVGTGGNPIQGSVLGAYAGLYLYTTVNGANQVSIKVSNLSSGSALVIINAFYLV